MGRRTTRKATPAGSIDLIVRRGALRRFQKLKEKTADLPVTVLWDRRNGDRRSTKASPNGKGERRNTDRRGKPPSMWDLSDFLVVTKPRKKK
jgi:hypothetical protein